MRILISGAGLAGLTTAFWLRRHGHEPVVVEKAPELRNDGYGLDFFGAGYDVAERMSIIDALAERQLFQGGDGGVAYVDTHGKILAELKYDSIREVLGGRYLPVMHGNLVEAVYHTVPDDVDVRFGTTITTIDQSDTAVTVTFDDGAAESFDLLVGADGIHSNVRRLAFGPEANYAVYLGYRFASYFLYGDYERAALWDNYVEPNREIGIYSSDSPDRLVAFLLWADPDDGWVEPSERAGRIRSLYGGAGWQTEQVLGELPGGDDILMDTATQIRMDTWRNGRVVLVGDAAGCMTLISGQGASMAMAGGYVLAEELGATDDWRQSLANFEARVKPQMDIRQTKAHDFAKRFVPGTKAAVTAQTALMKLITYHAFSGLLKTQFVGDSFLETAALERLGNSHDDVVGFRITGKLAPTDYATLSLTLDQVLADHVSVGLLVDMTGFAGIGAKALLDDWKLGRAYHDRIRQVAVVGDGAFAATITKLAAPLYAQAARHFPPGDIDQAWNWLRS